MPLIVQSMQSALLAQRWARAVPVALAQQTWQLLDPPVLKDSGSMGRSPQPGETPVLALKTLSTLTAIE